MESECLVINADKLVLDELEVLIRSESSDGANGTLPIARSERRKSQPIAGGLNFPSGDELLLVVATAAVQNIMTDSLKYAIVATIKPILLRLKEKFPKAKILVSAGHKKETIDLSKIEN